MSILDIILVGIMINLLSSLFTFIMLFTLGLQAMLKTDSRVYFEMKKLNEDVDELRAHENYESNLKISDIIVEKYLLFLPFAQVLKNLIILVGVFRFGLVGHLRKELEKTKQKRNIK